MINDGPAGLYWTLVVCGLRPVCAFSGNEPSLNLILTMEISYTRSESEYTGRWHGAFGGCIGLRLIIWQI